MHKIIKTATFIFASSLLMVSGCSDDEITVTPPGETTPPDETTPPGETPPVVAEPRGAENPPTLGAQIDRVGRPAISTALVGTFLSDDDEKATRKNEYNADDAPSTWAATWTPVIEGALGVLDSLDADCGNQLLADDDAEPGRYATLAGILADDRLYVNAASSTCGTYLGLEAEVVGALGAGEGGCGGRTPLDDVIDRSYSVLAAGLLTGVNDGLTEDADAVHDPANFPFLAAPL